MRILIIVILLTIPPYTSKAQHRSTNTSLFQNNFDSFKTHLQTLTPVYSLGDTLSSNVPFVDRSNFIDTRFLITYCLIDTTYEIAKPEKLTGYQCKLLGHYKFKNIFIILTYSTRTEAGDGNPIIMVSTLSHEGNCIDQIKIDLLHGSDSDLMRETLFAMSSDFQIGVFQKEYRYQENSNQRRVIDTTSSAQRFKINELGHFLKK